MSNLDSSWQASVIKLAQTGNLRAITFWLNRYLVPQGICAQVQVLPEQPDCLLVRVICRQAPDSDRLMRFVCNRLCQLNIQSLKSLRITAQVVGSHQILWEKSARIVPVETAAPGVASAPDHPPQSVSQTGAVTGTSTAVQLAVPPASIASQSPPVAAADGFVLVERASPPSAPAKRQTKSRKPGQPLSWRSQQRQWTQALQQRITFLRSSVLDATEQSVRWFSYQTPQMRAVLLGGSAVTAFLIGCGFELLGYYTDPNALPPSKATLTDLLPANLLPSASVKAVSERVTVIRPPVAQPDDPTITLLFSNSAALTRVPDAVPVISPTPDAPPPFYGIEPYRQADLVMTNLSQPLGDRNPRTVQAPSLALEETAETQVSRFPDASLDTNDANPVPDIGQDEHDEELAALDAEDTTEIAEPEAVFEESAAESIENPPEDSEPNLRRKQARPLQPADLVGNSVDIVSVVDDPVMQQGTAGLTSTLKLLEQSGVYPIGAGETPQSARRPQVFEVKGQRIAYLAYSDSSPHAVNDSAAGVNVGVSQQVEEDIKAVRDQVDWVIVNYGWNRELRSYPEEWQVSLAHSAIDHGADLVVGYHPTITQGAEIYKGRGIVYSLGSTLDEYDEKPAGNYDTAALQVTLDGHNMKLEFLPIQVKRGRAEIAEGELGTAIMQYIEQASSLFDQPLRSLTTLNAQLRLSLPAAPDTTMPTEPFINYPGSAPE